MNKRQSGFTLVEIAIVLVIIGLLLGGILKGQELINSARVRNLADTNSGIQAAYYGFIDRYRAVPGDMLVAAAVAAIGDATITVGGVNGSGGANGQLGNNPAAAAAAADWGEVSAAWVHMTRAGFLQGTFVGGASSAATYTVVANLNQGGPLNPFGGQYLLGRSRDYSTFPPGAGPAAANPARLALIFGDNIPVDIARELDVKIDDTNPLTGELRYTAPTGATITHGTVSEGTTAIGAQGCITAVTANVWNIAGNAQNCNLIYLY
jgi:prepilin-type N-terminal cleavage/methylation domain-containing protein